MGFVPVNLAAGGVERCLLSAFFGTGLDWLLALCCSSTYFGAGSTGSFD